jgi:tetratricopeptide (TPR) repeat protein
VIPRTLALAAVLAFAWAGHDGPAAQNAPASAGDLSDRAFSAAFNLDYDEAIALARRAVALAPDEPSTHRALASVVWLDILYLRGATTIDYYLGGMNKSDRTVPKPPAALDAEYQREAALAAQIAEARLVKNKKDVQALFDVGAAYALRASYAASVDGKVMGAFSAARKAYDAHETVLDKDPRRIEANLTVGTYRYIVAGMSLPTRLFAYLAGFGGDKARGIHMVEIAAGGGPSRADARFALMLLYCREQRYAEALRVIGKLEAQFPRNRLLVLEEGAMDLRQGHAANADAVLSRGIKTLDAETRRLFPGERALWLEKRGAARVVLNHRDDAGRDLADALRADPAGWVRGRITLELGKLADLAGRRAEALDRYREARQICDANNDPICSGEAGRFVTRPYTTNGLD